MRKLELTLTAAAAFALGALFTGSVQAGALGGAEGIRAAADQVRLAEPVHCIPGRVHRKAPPYDGCYRSSRRRHYSAPYAYYPQPYPYGYSRHYYSPGVTFGFSTGRRHGYGIGFGW